MTHSDAAPSRKASRLGLYAPWGLAVLLAVGWSLAWVWLSHQTAQRLDAGATRLRAQGWTVAWSARRIGGYPFRLDIDFDNLAVAEPSGWGVVAPGLKTEAYAWAPGRWVMFATAGLTLTRPGGGPVQVGARLLRASAGDFGEHPPRISVEGQQLTFTPAPGAKPFPIVAADSLELHTLAGPDDQGAVFVGLGRATVPPDGLVGLLAQGKPVDLKADAIFSHAGALVGRDWPSAARAWVHAGGALDLRQASVTRIGASVDAQSVALTIADDGHLAGPLTLDLSKAPQSLLVAGADQPIPPIVASLAAAAMASGNAQVALSFKDGRAMLGRAAIAPAPKIF
jgi:hypothetical protein